jgi:LacI family transcriptional regulator, repressor for deo operon, udp, cdd, tsx, nupC, and nupG
MANIQDVAQLAKVSVATVSRVINGSERVTAKTRQRVEAAVAQLSYVPNMLGRNLRTSASRSILVMVTSISNLFYLETIRGISEVATENGYEILLSETGEDLHRQIACLEKVKNHIADGAIIMEATIRDELLLELEKNYPVVQCGAFSDEASVPFVAVDNQRGGYLAARLLVEKGHRSIAFIGTQDQARFNRERKAGFLKYLAEAGIEQPDHLMTSAELSFEGGRRTALEIMQHPSPPSALFFVSDMQAVGALNGLIAAGFKIPGDVAVMGFDNIELSGMIIPGLTTVAQPMRPMGRESARLLLERIQGGSAQANKSVIFQPELILRQSV